MYYNIYKNLNGFSKRTVSCLMLLLFFTVRTEAQNQTIVVEHSWDLFGNAGTSPESHFIGTTDAKDIIFRTNNAERFRISSTGAGIFSSSLSATTAKFTATPAGNSGDALVCIDNLGNLRKIDVSGISNRIYSMGNGSLRLGENSLVRHTTGINNIALGNNSVMSLTTGSRNIGIGNLVLNSVVSGDQNIAIGDAALNHLINGSFNLAIGKGTAYGMTSGSHNIMIGNDVNLANTNGDNQLNIGYWIYGDNGNIGIGTTAPTAKLHVNGKMLVVDSFSGSTARFTQLGSGLVTDSIVTIDRNGNFHRINQSLTKAGVWSSSGNAGTSAGTSFLGTTDPQDLVFKTNNTRQLQITQKGRLVLGNDQTGDNKDIFIGSAAGYESDIFIASSASIGIGNNILGKLTSGGNNIVVGSNSLNNFTTGHLNTTYGNNSMPSLIKGSNNTTMGMEALFSLTNGDNNIGIGVNAGRGLATGSDNIFIGRFTIPGNINSSNQLNIGNWIYGDNGNIGIGTMAPKVKLHVNGKILTTDTLSGTAARFTQLSTGLVTDSLVTIDNGGYFRKIDPSLIKGMGWLRSGNSGTSSANSFIGTTDAQDLVFKTNNQERLRITNLGSLSIAGVAAGTASDEVVTIDNTGNLHKRPANAFSPWSYNGNEQLFTNHSLAIGTAGNGSHANASQPGTMLTINGRTHIGKAGGSDQSWINYEQSATVKDFLLYVQKGIITEDIGIATAQASDWYWSDFVFDEKYQLLPLEETAKFIAANKHLPDMPSAAEVAEKGYSIKKVNALFLQKIEELTLHAIEQQNTINTLRAQQLKTKILEEKIAKLEALVNKLLPSKP